MRRLEWSLQRQNARSVAARRLRPSMRVRLTLNMKPAFMMLTHPYWPFMRSTDRCTQFEKSVASCSGIESVWTPNTSRDVMGIWYRSDIFWCRRSRECKEAWNWSIVSEWLAGCKSLQIFQEEEVVRTWSLRCQPVRGVRPHCGLCTASICLALMVCRCEELPQPETSAGCHPGWISQSATTERSALRRVDGAQQRHELSGCLPR